MKNVLLAAALLLVTCTAPAVSRAYTCAELRQYLKQGYTVAQMEEYARSHGVSEETIRRYKTCLKEKE